MEELKLGYILHVEEQNFIRMIESTFLSIFLTSFNLIDTANIVIIILKEKNLLF